MNKFINLRDDKNLMLKPVYLRKGDPTTYLLEHENPAAISCVMLCIDTGQGNGVCRIRRFVADDYHNLVTGESLAIYVSTFENIKEVYAVPKKSISEGSVDGKRYIVIPNNVERKILRPRYGLS